MPCLFISSISKPILHKTKFTLLNETFISSPNSKYLITLEKSSLKVYTLNPHKLVDKYVLNTSTLKNIAFSLDFKFLYVLTDNKLQIYNHKGECGYIIGNFRGYNIQISLDSIILIGCFNIFVFSNTFSDNKMFECKNIYLQKIFSGACYFENGNIILYSNKNKLSIIKGGNEIDIEMCNHIVGLIANDEGNIIYSLCGDNKIYISRLDGRKGCVIGNDVRKMFLSKCGMYLYTLEGNRIAMYQGGTGLLMDESVGDECVEIFISNDFGNEKLEEYKRIQINKIEN